MVLGDLRIDLDNELHSYFAGETITGRVVLDIREAKRIERLSIQCLGIGRVEWRNTLINNQSPHVNSQNGNINNNRKKKGSWKKISFSNDSTQAPEVQSNATATGVYSTEEIYIDTSLSLLQPNTNGEVGSLEQYELVPTGTHSYPFEFRLPSSAPSSFQGPYGSVKYSLLATLSRPSKRISKQPHTLQIPFTLNGLLDLNKLNDNNGTGGELSKFDNGIKFVNCLPLRRNSTSKASGFHLKLDRTMYVPGEYIQFRADIRNFKKVDVASVVLSMIQETAYISNGVEKRGPGRETVCVARGPGVQAGTTEIWETNPIDSLFLQIPSIPPTNLATNSNLIRIHYHLQLELDYYGMKNIKGSIPITIGTIPLVASFKDFIQMPIKLKTKTNETTDPDETINSPEKTNADEKDGEVLTPDVENDFKPKATTINKFGSSFGYPDLVDPSYEEAAACFTPTTLNYLLMKRSNNCLLPKKPLMQSGGLSNSHSNGYSSSHEVHEEVDSDEEYIKENNCGLMLSSYDANYVPLYCKYVPSYGVDE